ncbi:MAG: bacteriohemerythrin [Defluviitaleaceae bacterium]|nr:bacteriohemerythrin [Defluviitaleaceae bacterium]
MALWNSSFETGNELVDNDHKEIFSLVEHVLTSSHLEKKDKVGIAINFLSDYVVYHFENEERLMKESDYPETEAHKKEHADFLAVAIELKDKFENNAYYLGANNDNNSLHLSMEINKTVVTWLTKHVMGSDKKLADHYKKWKV